MRERPEFDYTHGLDACTTLIQAPYSRGTSEERYRLSVTHERKPHIILRVFTALRTIMNIRTLHPNRDDTHGDTHVAWAIRAAIRKRS